MHSPLRPRPLRFCVALVGVFVAALVGAVVGIGMAALGFLPQPSPRYAGALVNPLPHHVARYPGGVSLRFAMVHDVIHERFPRHGAAYFQERNRLVRQQLKQGKKLPAEKQFALIDDLGVGLERLGQHEEAIRLLHDKLRRQQAEKITGRPLYTTYANLGTFLIHAGFPLAVQGEPDGRKHLHEGLGLIHKAIEVNPQAHFGREIWQAVAVEFLLAALDDPQLLLRFDLVGDRLDHDLDPARNRSYLPAWSQHHLFASMYAHSDFGTFDERASYRKLITTVGAEDGWQAVRTSHDKPVPFDEPVLGIIGMWRLGGGANPHFALALGEIMLRIGQRYIAWSAYERAVRLADRFNKDPQIRNRFIEHCRTRQALIEGQLPASEVADLRPRFEAELELGQKYQKAYEAYEAKQIAAGVALDDPHFYEAFEAQEKPIASPVGGADQFLTATWEMPAVQVFPVAILCAGLFAFLAATALRVAGRRRAVVAVKPASPAPHADYSCGQSVPPSPQ